MSEMGRFSITDFHSNVPKVRHLRFKVFMYKHSFDILFICYKTVANCTLEKSASVLTVQARSITTVFIMQSHSTEGINNFA